jgi:hypothetical protein
MAGSCFSPPASMRDLLVTSLQQKLLVVTVAEIIGFGDSRCFTMGAIVSFSRYFNAAELIGFSLLYCGKNTCIFFRQLLRKRINRRIEVIHKYVFELVFEIRLRWK